MITPKGKLLFVSINGNESTMKGIPTGKYSARLELSKEDYEAFKQQLENVWEASKEYEEVKDEVDVMNPSLGVSKKKDKETGEIRYYINAKINIKSKDGQERTVIVENGHAERLPDNTQIPNGSTGRLSVYPMPWKSAMGYGLSLKLQKIQLIHVASFKGDEFPIEDDGDEEEVIF